jgi:hypothetical protein
VRVGYAFGASYSEAAALDEAAPSSLLRTTTMAVDPPKSCTKAQRQAVCVSRVAVCSCAGGGQPCVQLVGQHCTRIGQPPPRIGPLIASQLATIHATISHYHALASHRHALATHHHTYATHLESFLDDWHSLARQLFAPNGHDQVVCLQPCSRSSRPWLDVRDDDLMACKSARARVSKRVRVRVRVSRDSVRPHVGPIRPHALHGTLRTYTVA